MKMNEIFTSIDGEVNYWGQGRISTFIRLAGCNLDCSYCDTKYTKKEENSYYMDYNQIIEEVKKIGCKKITITGGEPLLQEKELLQHPKMISISIEKYKYLLRMEYYLVLEKEILETSDIQSNQKI